MTVLAQERDDVDIAAIPWPLGFQCLRRPCRFVTKGEVLANHDGPGMKLMNKDLLDVLGGAQGGQASREIDGQEVVHTQLFRHRLTVLQTPQETWSAFRCEHLDRVGFECHQHAGNI